MGFCYIDMLELFGEDVPDTPPQTPNEILVNITSPYSDPGIGYLQNHIY